MNERKRKILKVSLIIAAVALIIVAIVESFVLISLNQKINDTTNSYNQIEDQLENLEKSEKD